MRRKVLSVVLCVCMMMTMAPFAFAEDAGTVATLGDTAYTNIDTALADWATSGGTLTLRADCTTEAGKSGAWNVNVTKEAVLDLNGHTLTMGTNKYIKASANLTIQDSGSNGKLYSPEYFYVVQGIWSATITINGGEICNDTKGAISTNGPVIMNGGKLTGASESYGLSVSNNNICINGGEINILMMSNGGTLNLGTDDSSVAIGKLVVSSNDIVVNFNNGIVGEYSTNNNYYRPTLNSTSNAYFLMTFPGVPSGKYLKTVEKDGNTYYQLAELTEADAVAKVITADGAETLFADTSAAAAAVKAGDTLKILKDYNSSNTVRIQPGAGSVTVDLNGKTVTNTDGPALYVMINGDYDATEPYTVTVKNGALTSGNGVALRVDSVNNAANVVTENVTMTPSAGQNAVDLQDKARLTFTDEAAVTALVGNGFAVTVDGVNYVYGIDGGLGEAVRALSAAGGTVKLLNDYTGSNILKYQDSSNKPVVLDLNGKTYNSTAQSSWTSYVVELSKPNSNLTIQNGTIKSVAPYVIAALDTANNLKLTLDNVKLEAAVNGFTINGTATGNETVIRNSTIAAQDTGIYYPANGNLTIENSTISGQKLGVALKGGQVNISGDNTKISATANEKAPTNYYDGSTSTSLTAEGYALYVEGGYNWDTTVTISGGSFSSKGDSVKKYVKNGDNTYTRTITITGGYFSNDPTAYCGTNAEGKPLTGVANTTATKAEYPWTVGVKGDKAAPVVSSSLPASVPANASEELKDAAKAMTEGAEMTSDAIEAAVASTANDNNILADATHAVALNAIKAPIDPDITVDKVKIVYQTYVDMQLTDVKSTPSGDGSSHSDLYELTVNLTPKYRVIATTNQAYSEWEKGNLTQLLVEGDEALKADNEKAPNSILVESAKTLDLPDAEYQIVIPLPQMFPAEGGQKLSVKHEKQNGTVEYYTGTVTYDTYTGKYLTFTTNGFSPFTISAAAAFIGDTAYPTFQEAVDAAQNNDVITLVKSDDVSATMSGASRTITVKASTGTVNVTVNGETKEADATNGATFTYTRPSHSSSGSTTTSYNVNVTAATNGTVAADKKTAAKGATVTVTATPSAGYVVEAVKVTDKDGKDVAVTAKDGKYVFTMPGSAVTVTGSFKAETPAESGLPFVDVKNGDWFYDAVKYAYENGLMTGTSATTFAPNGTMNRAMIVTVLYRLEKSPAVTAAAKFTDVPAGQWYSDAVAWAAANGIVNGYDETTFGPMNAVTREQLAAILFRYEQSKGLENVTLEENLNRFPDQDKISAYAVPALQWAVGQKVINGNADGTLDPTGTATRAQVAQILMNLLQ